MDVSKLGVAPLTLLDNQIANGAAQVFTFSRESSS
jgi:hypothetical protein